MTEINKQPSKSKKIKFQILKKIKPYFVPGVLSLILLILIGIAYLNFIKNKYYPITLVGNTNISFLTQGEAIRKLENKFNQRTQEKLQFESTQGTFTIDLATSSASLNYSGLSKAFKDSRGNSLIEYLQKQLLALISTNKISPKITFYALDIQTDPIAEAVNKPYLDTTLTFDETTTPEGSPSARIQIKEGVDGLSLDKQKLEENISQFILTGKYSKVLPIKSVPPKVTTQHIIKAKQALENTLKEPVKLVFEEKNWTLDTKQLLTLLDLENGESLFDKKRLDQYLAKIASEINQEVQEGLFEFNPQTKRVANFAPSREGRKLDTEKTSRLLNESLDANSATINLPVNVVKPKIQTSDVNSLGIKELLGSGVSHFAGSIPNRIYNINLAASRINGVLVTPGEEFSFNEKVGDISGASGYRQAYVIKSGRTVLDDGGGVCQVSSTIFRTILNSGLPITARTAHAYRVGYYEQGFPPGLDATIWAPQVDFKFKNDTPAHILIQAYTSGLTLYIDLYGTLDGRVTKLTTPVITNQTPPPPELRQDDPTLPKGTVKQVDFPAWGARVIFSRTVTRGTETLIKENFVSNYKAWQAIYLVGTQ